MVHARRLTFVLILLLPICIHGQSNSNQICLSPTAETFAEVIVRSTTDLGGPSRRFMESILEEEETQGIIFVFGGSKSRLDEVSDITSWIESEIGVRSAYDGKIWIREGGYRREATVVFFIKRLKCSSYSTPLGEIEVDAVDFDEFPHSESLRVSSENLYARQRNGIEATCPPTAAAIGLCNYRVEVKVFVAVDEKGKTVFAKAIGAHPLLRAKSELLAKMLTYEPLEIEGKLFKSLGVITIHYQEGPEIIAN